MKNVQPPVKAVLFDLDDTLLSRKSAFARYCADLYHSNEAMQQFHTEDEAISLLLSWDFNSADTLNFRGQGSRSRQDFFADVISQWPTIFDNVSHAVEMFEETMPRMLTLEPQTRQLLENLHRDRIPTCIVTNGGSTMQAAKIINTGLDSLVDAYVISEDAGAWKPDKAIFEKALSLIEADPSTTMFIGDNPEADILGAKGLGMRTAWMRLNRSWPYQSQKPDFIFENVWDLGDIIPSI